MVLIDAADICSALVARLRPPASRLDGIDRYVALRALSLFSQLGVRGPDGLLILRHRTRATLALSTLARGGGWLGFAGFPDMFDDSVRRLHRNGLCELFDAGDLMPFEADR